MAGAASTAASRHRGPAAATGPATDPDAPSVAPGRLLGALSALPDARLLDRLIRGRLRIGLVAFALIGIVAMQLMLLKLNTGIGHAIEHEQLLARQNATLQIAVSEASAPDRIEAEAQQLGMYPAPPARSVISAARCTHSPARSSARSRRPSRAPRRPAPPRRSPARRTPGRAPGASGASTSTSAAGTGSATGIGTTASTGTGTATGTGTGTATGTGTTAGTSQPGTTGTPTSTAATGTSAGATGTTAGTGSAAAGTAATGAATSAPGATGTPGAAGAVTAGGGSPPVASA